MTQRLGLIGRDISYSLSPRIHEASARHLGIDATYHLHDIATADAVRQFLDNAWQSDITGLNITQPWKNVLGTAPVNTLYREPGKSWWCHVSTDAAGFFAGLVRIDCHKKDIRQVVFLGSGGVVTAIRAELSAPVRCLMRNPDPRREDQLPWNPDTLTSLLDADGTLLVQATPAPLRGDRLEYFADALRAAGKTRGMWFVDLCYGHTSSILDVAQGMGLPAQDGLPMLIEQARAAQEIWWGESAPYQLIEDSIRG